MSRQTRARWSILAAALAFAAGTSLAQTYPAKTIRIVAAEPGGGADFTARLIAAGVSGPLGRPVIIDNRAGVVAADTVAKAAPDGYTFLFHGSTVWLLPYLQENAPYDPLKDLTPVVLAVAQPNLLVVHPSLPVKGVADLLALARARPGELNYASAGTGGTPHLAGELLKSMAKVNIVRVNYKGIGVSLAALMSGEVQLMLPVAASALPHVKSKRLKALAVTSKTPSPLTPGVPTVAASGIPGYESISILGMFAPAGTPPAVVNRVNREIVQFLTSAETKEKIFNAGAEVIASSPEQFGATVKSEMEKWGKIIKAARIQE